MSITCKQLTADLSSAQTDQSPSSGNIWKVTPPFRRTGVRPSPVFWCYAFIFYLSLFLSLGQREGPAPAQLDIEPILQPTDCRLLPSHTPPTLVLPWLSQFPNGHSLRSFLDFFPHALLFPWHLGHCTLLVFFPSLSRLGFGEKDLCSNLTPAIYQVPGFKQVYSSLKPSFSLVFKNEINHHS